MSPSMTQLNHNEMSTPADTQYQEKTKILIPFFIFYICLLLCLSHQHHMSLALCLIPTPDTLLRFPRRWWGHSTRLDLSFLTVLPNPFLCSVQGAVNQAPSRVFSVFPQLLGSDQLTDNWKPDLEGSVLSNRRISLSLHYHLIWFIFSEESPGHIIVVWITQPSSALNT